MGEQSARVSVPLRTFTCSFSFAKYDLKNEDFLLCNRQIYCAHWLCTLHVLTPRICITSRTLGRAHCAPWPRTLRSLKSICTFVCSFLIPGVLVTFVWSWITHSWILISYMIYVNIETSCWDEMITLPGPWANSHPCGGFCYGGTYFRGKFPPSWGNWSSRAEKTLGHWVCWSWLSMVDDGDFEMICLSFKFETHVGVLKAGAFSCVLWVALKVVPPNSKPNGFSGEISGFGWTHDKSYWVFMLLYLVTIHNLWLGEGKKLIRFCLSMLPIPAVVVNSWKKETASNDPPCSRLPHANTGDLSRGHLNFHFKFQMVKMSLRDSSH